MATQIAKIAKDRDASLRDKGYSTDVLNGLRKRISVLDVQIAEANRLRSEVIQYRDWLETLWSQRPTHEQDQKKAEGDAARLKRESEDVLIERKDATDKKQAAIKEVGEKIDKHERKRVLAISQTRDLVHWPQDQITLKPASNRFLILMPKFPSAAALESTLDDLREKIRQGVEEIRRQMSFDCRYRSREVLFECFGSIGLSAFRKRIRMDGNFSQLV